ncbi:hypothetical protein EYF80_020107 [Liparis tanakae]|uniref:Uncharacterized protein n=1 Tax=Liparis tanakae TaxID=230148 RepID=A0A4Z2HV89_9TELE|nr:hypothetical protein EYF80_020107 [Liparis tanakae]
MSLYVGDVTWPWKVYDCTRTSPKRQPHLKEGGKVKEGNNKHHKPREERRRIGTSATALQLHFHSVLVGHDVGVGHNLPVFRHNKARTAGHRHFPLGIAMGMCTGAFGTSTPQSCSVS